MSGFPKLLLSAVCWPCLSVQAAQADLPDLIPRQLLFGNPEKASPQVSPDGKFLAYLAPDEGVLNVWIRTLGKENDHPVTKDRGRGIRFFGWAYNNKELLYIQDQDGDENWHLYAAALATQKVRDLTPYSGVQARNVMMDPGFPDELQVGLNRDNPRLHDIYHITLSTGVCEKAYANPGDVVSWLTDTAFKLRGAFASRPDGGFELRVRDQQDSAWRSLVTWSAEDALTSAPIGFTPDNSGLYVRSSKGTDTAALIQISLKDGSSTVLAQRDDVDLGSIVVHPTRHHVQAVSFVKDRAVWQTLDPEMKRHLVRLIGYRDGDFSLLNRDLEDKIWIVAYETDNGPVAYYKYDCDKQESELLFTNRPQLEKYTLARMNPVTIPARDGLKLHGYLTFPPGVRPHYLPAVLLVHGGPWGRDTWGYEPTVQWLANRGYAVLQVNFRGSTGYGKKFTNAGDREWGGRMHDDLIDGVNWLIERGYADRNRIAIFGGSYGGYATLVGLTFTPEVFACGVDIVGPSNLVTFMNTIPPYWEPLRPLFERRIGKTGDEAFLKSRSPLFKVANIKKPLIIAQGANDPRVKKSESDQIVMAMKEANIPVEYMVFEDEGHGFARPENRLEFYAAAEAFLAKHIGGRHE